MDEKLLCNIYPIFGPISYEKKCDECHQQLNDDSDLAVHLQHRKSFCAARKKEFNSPADLKEHVKKAHGLHHNI
jgi:hypothetical protein